MIKINEEKNIFFNEEKDYEEQSEELKEYVMGLYELIKKVPYPKFNVDGSITYRTEDNQLKIEITRIQQYPGSKSNRAVKETIIKINKK